MRFILYIDTYFLINFCMNLILLTILASMLKEVTRLMWRVIGAIVGAFGSCLAVLYPQLHSVIRILFLYIILGVVMIFIVFHYKNLFKLLLTTMKLYILAFFIGGCLRFFIENSQVDQYDNLTELNSGKPTTISLLLIGLTIVVVCMPKVFQMIQNAKKTMDTIFFVELQLQGKKVTLKGLLDTGNELREPISRKPVVIGEYNALKLVIPEDLMDCTTRLKVIPYHSLGEKNGTIYGIVFDRIEIFDSEKRYSKDNVIVGLYHGCLSSRQEYQLILHEELLR